MAKSVLVRVLVNLEFQFYLSKFLLKFTPEDFSSCSVIQYQYHFVTITHFSLQLLRNFLFIHPEASVCVLEKTLLEFSKAIVIWCFDKIGGNSCSKICGNFPIVLKNSSRVFPVVFQKNLFSGAILQRTCQYLAL